MIEWIIFFSRIFSTILDHKLKKFEISKKMVNDYDSAYIRRRPAKIYFNFIGVLLNEVLDNDISTFETESVISILHVATKIKIKFIILSIINKM